MKYNLNRLRAAVGPLLMKCVRPLVAGGYLGPRTRDKLWRIAQKYITFYGVERVVSTRYGTMMRVSSAPRVEQEIFIFGEWEPLFSRYIKNAGKLNGVFIDIGANIGYFSLIARNYFDEVHAIEASPATIGRLQDNIALNGFDNIIVHGVAVGARSGRVRFFQDEGQSGGASVFDGEGKIFEAEVPVEPLEVILDGVDWNRVRFVKIDVEGSEAAVLASLAEICAHTLGDIEIFVEFDPEIAEEVWSAIERFLKMGFDVRMIQGIYDRGDYLDLSRESPMRKVDRAPDIFCDLLLRRVGHSYPKMAVETGGTPQCRNG